MGRYLEQLNVWAANKISSQLYYAIRIPVCAYRNAQVKIRHFIETQHATTLGDASTRCNQATAATTGAHNHSCRVRKKLEIIFLRIQMEPSGPPSSISSPFPFCCQLELDVRTYLAESRACENEHFRINLTISLWSLTCSTAEVAKLIDRGKIQYNSCNLQYNRD